MPKPQISAIICTYNRSSYLGAAIDSLLCQDFEDFEVLVIDNASSDDTKEVVNQRLGNRRLRYVWEPVVGLSVARNRGAQMAEAEILAYLDDDAVASKNWLGCLYRAFQIYQNVVVAGGKVTLLWPDNLTSPKWLSAGLAENLGAYDLGEKMIYIEQPSLTPRGLNYAIRRSFWQEIGGFDVNLGRVGKNLLSNEELQVTEMALKLAKQVAYLPDAVVGHNVAPERIRRSWFLRRGWWQGISECYREQLAGEAGLGQFGRGGERFVRGLYKSLKYFQDPALCFDNLVYCYGQVGYLSAVVGGFLLGGQKNRQVKQE
ncbi:glycosyltransferase [Ancylothrix sp. C2]|uniref:glycosyltransferase family 2 protein n=1 Tax=Ancylothrix sp. D3o TaxID=2953691 RepID=UPI0021BAD3C8|nr:glycosyltransferase family 2 protein [Ancylothrix sp. D3o]MCT7948727.1 glycosyltransferase [Ancylothrix sp. D3o]